MQQSPRLERLPEFPAVWAYTPIISAAWVFVASELAALTALGPWLQAPPWVACLAWLLLVAGLSWLTLHLLSKRRQT